MNISIEAAIDRIRQFRKATGLSKNALAKKADMPEGNVRRIDESDWNPTTDTLRALDKIVPTNFALNDNRQKKPPHKPKPRASSVNTGP